jgi:hypothetical protein
VSGQRSLHIQVLDMPRFAGHFCATGTIPRMYSPLAVATPQLSG